MNKITINIVNKKIHVAIYDSKNPENKYKGIITERDLNRLLSDPKVKFKEYTQQTNSYGEIVERIVTKDCIIRITGFSELKDQKQFINVKRKIEEAKAITEYKKKKNSKEYKANRNKSQKGKLKLATSIIILLIFMGIISLNQSNKTITDVDAITSAAPSLSEMIINNAKEADDVNENMLPKEDYQAKAIALESKVSKEPEQVVPQISQIITFDYENNYNCDKVKECKENYLEVLSKYAEMYGIDGNFFLAQACQEKGFHSSIPDAGGGIGILQIQYAVWEGTDYEAYNFQTNSYDKVHILYLGEDKSNRQDGVIEIDLRQLEDQVRLSAMIDSNLLSQYNGNYELASYAYNWGPGAAYDNIMKYCQYSGLTYEEVKNGNYTNEIREFFINQYGSNYFLKVSQFFPNARFQLTAKTLKNGEVKEIVTDIQNSRVMSPAINNI